MTNLLSIARSRRMRLLCLYYTHMWTVLCRCCCCRRRRRSLGRHIIWFSFWCTLALCCLYSVAVDITGWLLLCQSAMVWYWCFAFCYYLLARIWCCLDFFHVCWLSLYNTMFFVQNFVDFHSLHFNVFFICAFARCRHRCRDRRNSSRWVRAKEYTSFSKYTTTRIYIT